MAILYGINSTEAANTKLPNGADLFTSVMRQSGFPAFWGRSLSGDNKITKEEGAYLKSKNCKVALIFDELTESQVSSKNGSGDAMRAIDAAQALDVPANQNIALFADIKNDWNVNHDWMVSYANTLLDNGYIPGFIGNTDASANYNFDIQCNKYVQSMQEIARDSTVYWATAPKLGEPGEWTPYCPSTLAPEHISMWRSGGNVTFGDYTATVNYSRDESVMDFMWDAAAVTPMGGTFCDRCHGGGCSHCKPGSGGGGNNPPAYPGSSTPPAITRCTRCGVPSCSGTCVIGPTPGD